MPTSDISYEPSGRNPRAAPEPHPAQQARVDAPRTVGGIEATNITEEVVARLDALTNQAIDLLGRSLPDESPHYPWSVQRPCPDAPSALERAMCVNDLLHESACRLERLIHDLRPLESRCRTYQPTAGYHRWDPAELVRSLSAESDRLARSATRLLAETPSDLSAGARKEIVLFIADLVAKAVAGVRAQLADATMTLPKVAEQSRRGE